MSTRSVLPPVVCSLLLALAIALPASADGPSLVVEIDGLRSEDGVVRGALFAAEQGWTEPGHEIATCSARIHGHHATCVIDPLEAGSYAFAYLHDENANGRFDRDFIGWPQEGFGFSNDAAPSFGPPSYASARFDHGERTTSLHLHARYGL